MTTETLDPFCRHASDLSRHGEEPAEALAKAGVSNHEAAPSFETRSSSAPQDEAGRGFRRHASDLLCLWGLCERPACRRARQCRRDPQSCLARYAPLAPEAARFGALALLQGALDGVGIEEVRQYVPLDIAAMESWRARIGQSACKAGPNAVPAGDEREPGHGEA